jgi:hypothetical protein
MTILPNAEKQGELVQLGGWQKEMARRGYQKRNLREPFGSLAFSETRKAAVKQPIFVDELLPSSRNVSSGKLCRIGLRQIFGRGKRAGRWRLCAVAVAAPKSNSSGSSSR